MTDNDQDYHFPLKEQIGKPDLLVERRAEFEEYFKWVSRIPKEVSKSRAILGRKKSGKTAFLQRLFNRVWCANGEVIPFYIEVPEGRTWLLSFGLFYYQTFASQYISFLERDPTPVRFTLSLAEIRDYGIKKGNNGLVRDVDALLESKNDQDDNRVWHTAHTAPHRHASIHNKRFLVMIDEFQNLASSMYTNKDRTILDDSIPGSFHQLSESKIAPMLVTGSAMGKLGDIIDRQLEAGRLYKVPFAPYLSEDEGLEAVYRYAETLEEPVSNESAVLLNRLCYSDAYFINCVFQSRCPNKRLDSAEGVIEAVRFETSHTESILGMGWLEWFEHALDRVNGSRAKKIVLLLTKYPKRIWTPKEVKETLQLDIDVKAVYERLEVLRQGELIRGTLYGKRYQGYEDGTFFLMLQNQCEEELAEFDPPIRENLDDKLIALRKSNASLQGQLNNAAGRLAELQLAYDMRTRSTFDLSDYFEGLSGAFILKHVHLRFMLQHRQGFKKELDLKVEGASNQTLLVEVKKQKVKTNLATVATFCEKVELFKNNHSERTVSAGFLSLGGFTEEALECCRKQGVGTADHLNYCQTEWSDFG